MEAHSLARDRGGITLPRSRKLLAALGDERLVDQLRRGNEAAFEVLFDRHHAGVLSYCRHMLGSRDEAEDALQQAFISAHADIVSSNKPIRFKAWIYTIARNRCLSTLRARREQPSDDLERVSTAGLTEEVEQRAELKVLLRDMQELPPEQRSALILSELGDLSHSEVAEVIGCEAQKVKSLVFQARSGLIERRQARETPCEDIREQLSTLRGGSLRRGPLRRHLKACPGCREFRAEVRRQRQMVAAILPVIPTVGLKESALAAAGVSTGSALGGGAFAGGGAVLAAKASVAKVAVIAVATGGAVGGAVAVQQDTRDGDGRTAPARSESTPAAPASAVSQGETRRGAERNGTAGAGAGRERGERARGEGRGGDGKRGERGAERKRGFEPVRGGSNGERARDFARTRGKGRKRGLDKDKQIARGGANRPERARKPEQRPQPQRRPQAPPARGPEPRPEPQAQTPPPLLPELTPRGSGPRPGGLKDRVAP